MRLLIFFACLQFLLLPDLIAQRPMSHQKTTQAEWNFFAGPDLSFGFPLGKIRDSVSNGTGFQVRAEYFLMPQINVGIRTGYKSYKYDEVMVGKGHFSYIPITLTGTYYFSEENIRPYVNLGLGVYLARQKYDADFWTLVHNTQTNKLDTIYNLNKVDNKQTKFGFSPSAGVLYHIQDEFYANFSLGFEMLFTEPKPSKVIGINMGMVYRFGI